MNTNNFLTLLLFLSVVPTQTYGMFSKASRLWRNPKVKAAAVATGIGTGLYAAGCTYDHIKGNTLTFVDVSTPQQPRIIEDLIASDEELDQSVTRLQLINDWYLSNHPIAAAYRCVNNMDDGYHAIADSVLFAHFWVLLPTLRKQLVNLVMNISCNEVEQRNNGNITLVSGTNQGASILLRTIFDEILNDHPHQNFVELRDQNIVNALEQYDNIGQYYDANSYEVVTYPGHRAPGQFIQGPDTIERILDATKQASQDTISANFGFFGQSRDLIDGAQESSAEFVTRSCSWAWQLLRCHNGFSWIVTNNLPAILRMIKGYISNGNFHVSLDRCTKPELNHLFQNIFSEHGIEHLYNAYQDELQSMDAEMSAGILQLFITEHNAGQWGYAAKRLGTRTKTDTNAVYLLETTEVQDLPQHQARILMHPDICNPEHTSMRFYILGEPTKIRSVIDRMYQIAEEVKSLRD